MLSPEALAQLKGRKNLLAFSGGGDSTALFFLLLDAHIPFDIALVNYRTRPKSNEEAAYAQELAKKYEKRSFILNASIEAKNFEHEARRVRYNFFSSLIASQHYDNLITAHQLDDRLEWLLMQMCKGAGLPEMMGMRSVEAQEGYALVRPLLQQSKADLLAYLENNGRTWFEDESNSDERYTRNYFRRRFSAPLLKRFQSGIAKSLEFLDEDLETLMHESEVKSVDDLYYFATPANHRSTLATVDKILKRCGFLMRQGDKERLKMDTTAVVGRRYVVAVGDNYTFIVPYVEAVLDKPFKEACRKLGAEPKMRPYLYRSKAAFQRVSLLLGDGIDLHCK